MQDRHYYRLIIVLIYLCPESLWELNQVDMIELKRMPTLVEAIENFLEKGSIENKYLIIINSVYKVTHQQVRLIDVT